MAASHQREIQHLERRLQELKRLAADEPTPGAGAMRPTRNRAHDSLPPAPGAASTPSPPRRESSVAPAAVPEPRPKKKAPAPRKKALSPEDMKRMERAVVGLVVVFFGSCVAFATVEQGEGKASSSAPPAEPEQVDAETPPRRAEAPPRRGGADPMALCQRLVDAGAAVECAGKESLQEGVRLAEFTMGHSAEEKGVVRTFDTVARCESSDSGVLSGGARFARCDVRAMVLLATGASADDTSAARRVMTSL